MYVKIKAPVSIERFIRKFYDPDELTGFLEFICHLQYKKPLSYIFDWLNSDKNRIKVKINDYDVWNLDNTLALIILPSLIRLKEDQQSAGRVADEDVPDNIKSTNAKPKESEFDIDEFYFDRWNYVINEMIFAFTEIVKDDDSRFFTDNDRMFDKLGYDEYHARIDNGTRLFGKYYRNLWS